MTANPQDQEMTALDRLRDYARQPVAPKLVAETTFVPTTERRAQLSSKEEIASAMAGAATEVKENVPQGGQADKQDDEIRRQITLFQQRKGAAEGCPLSRLVHREQLHGGRAEVHWNPAVNELLQLFDASSSAAWVRVSDASHEANPDGKSMFGFTMEIAGREGQPTDVLLTGGTPRAEVSQAKDSEAQLALFNMLNGNKLTGIGRILTEVGPLDGPKMLLDVGKMRTDLPSVSDLTAYSRAPFALDGKDGKEYLVKMRVAPSSSTPGAPGVGEKTSERQISEMGNRLQAGDVRYTFELQFMRPGENADDPRARWSGPWLKAAEVVLPQVSDTTLAAAEAEQAEAINFTPWKGKEPYSQSLDKDVLRPFGELNRARWSAYQASQNNRA